MNQNEKEILRPFEADGIKEFDNALPRWWVWLFYISAILGISYGVRLHFFSGESLIEAYDAALVEHAKLQAASAPESQTEVETSVGTLEERLSSSDYVAAGKEVFATNCAPCHGPDGGGVVGPNLTDKYWLHGNKPEDLVKVIGDGVPEKGMVAWKPILGLKKVEEAAAYIRTLVGTVPETAKAPEGQLLE